MKEKDNFVYRVRKAMGEKQESFADRIGVGLRTLKRFELEDTLPTSKAALRALEELAREHNVARDAE